MIHFFICPDLDQAIESLAAHMPPGEAAQVLAPWTVVVAGSSAQRIVSQRLSHVLGSPDVGVHGGVSANIKLEMPIWLNRLVEPNPPSPHPWAIDAMAWKLMGVAAEPGIRRWNTARRVADDLDRSQLWRPDVVMDWLRLSPTDRLDSLHTDLGEVLAYLRGQIAEPTLVEQAVEAIGRAKAGEPMVVPGLSEYRPLMLYGVYNLSGLHLSALAAYAKTHEVYWWVTTPMVATAQQILGNLPAPDQVRMDASGTFIVRDDRSRVDVSALVETPLNRANGRKSIEGLQGLAQVGALAGATVTTLAGSPFGDSILGRVQQSIHLDTPSEPMVVGEEERNRPSIARVACSRPQRQVEALRDYLMHCFMDDPTLQPRDVIVACPDPHTWEASIRKVFAAGIGRPNLRVRLIDPYARFQNPVADVILRLLESTEGQFTRIQLVELLAMSPVAAKFGFAEQAIEDITAYLEATNMTWGLNPQDRTRFGLPAYAGGTLADSIEQLTLGITRLDDGLGDLPALGIKSGNINLVGQFFAAATAVAELIEQARSPQPVSTGWVPLIERAIESSCWVDFDHQWQVSAILRELARLSEIATDGPGDVTNGEFTAVFKALRVGGSRRGDIGAGDLVITSLANARGLHHRVVCLLGMDEGRVPRPRTRVSVPGWGPERAGDQDAALSDRQAWLDLLAGSAKRLAMFWSAPPQGGEAHPSVMVTDLTRTIEHLVGGPANVDEAGYGIRRAALHRWSVLDHVDRPSSDRRAAELAQINFESSAKSFTSDRLANLRVDDPVLPETLSINDLIRFGQDPLHAYARHTLGIGWLGDGKEPGDVVINADPSGLTAWKVMNQALESGEDTKQVIDRAIRSGVLPMRELIGDTEKNLNELLELINKAVQSSGLSEAQPVITSINLPIETRSGRVIRIVDRLRLLRLPDGTYALSAVTVSSYKSRTMWGLWVPFLVAQAAFPGMPISTIYICKGYKRALNLDFLPLTTEQVTLYMRELMETVEEGLTNPLIAPMATALAWAKPDSESAAGIRKAWEGSSFGFGKAEAAAGSVIRLIGGNLPAEWVLNQQTPDGTRHLDVVHFGIWKHVLNHLPESHPEWKVR